MGVPADDDGLHPAGHQPGDVLADDGLPEHGAAQDVADGAVGRAPHLLQLELLHAVLVGRDGGALDAHVVALHRLRRLHRHAVVSGVSALHAQVVAGGGLRAPRGGGGGGGGGGGRRGMCEVFLFWGCMLIRISISIW